MKTVSLDSSYLSDKLYAIYDKELQALEDKHGIQRSHVEVTGSTRDGKIERRTFYIKKGPIARFRKEIRPHWDDFLRRYPKAMIRFK